MTVHELSAPFVVHPLDSPDHIGVECSCDVLVIAADIDSLNAAIEAHKRGKPVVDAIEFRIPGKRIAVTSSNRED